MLYLIYFYEYRKKIVSLMSKSTSPTKVVNFLILVTFFKLGASFEGGWGTVAPPPKKKKKRKKKEKR